ncbi:MULTISPECIES: hypothetical protein, partial [unclassified Microcoleus]
SFWHSLFDGGAVPPDYIMVDRPDMILHHSQEQAFRPVPQRVSFIVGWASCPPIKGSLRITKKTGFWNPMRKF